MSDSSLPSPELSEQGAPPPELSEQAAPPPELSEQGPPPAELSGQGPPPPELSEQGPPPPELDGQGPPPFELPERSAGAGVAGANGVALLRSLTPVLLAWLPRQRWFAGKGRPLTGFSLVSATELLPCRPVDARARRTRLPGLLHLLVRAQQPDRAGCAGHPRGGDCYQLLLGVREALPPRLAPCLIGRPESGPLVGTAVYEALHDPRLTAVLLERLRVAGRLGPLRFCREPDADIPTGLPARPLASEQSNSSVVYGTSAILKLFRRVEAGINPDLELTLALARNGYAQVPAPTAWFEAVAPVPPGREGPAGHEDQEGRDSRDSHEGVPAAGAAEQGRTLTLGVLQPFLGGTTDGWQLAQRALTERRDFTTAARALGRTTARVHTGLAEALPTSTLGGERLERVARQMASRLDAACAAVPDLRPYRAGLLRSFRALAELGRAGGVRAAQRVHGDLHLGQVLAADDGGDEERWTLIDFEGEPARPLAERRAHQPVVRDIAGMLRSFDYAACRPGHGPTDAWARHWAAANRAAYCAGYAAACGADPRDDGVLLRAYETDKAVYEVLYEARNRPAWLGVPMSAIRRLAAPDDG